MEGITDWAGEFRGWDYKPEQLDSVLAFAFNRGDVEAARSFFHRKWWDYRFIHPGHAFFLFTHHYREAIIRYRPKFGVPVAASLKACDHPIWRTEIDPFDGSKTRTLSPKVFRTGLWRAMCFADDFGIPYKFWIDHAFDNALSGGWKRIPQPSNLYGVGTIRYVQDKWEEAQRELLHLPASKAFFVEGYRGHPWQDDQQRWLLEWIARRPRPEFALRQYMVIEGRVLESHARAKLPGPVVDKALA